MAPGDGSPICPGQSAQGGAVGARYTAGGVAIHDASLVSTGQPADILAVLSTRHGDGGMTSPDDSQVVANQSPSVIPEDLMVG